MWKNCVVKFREVGRNEKATFRVVYSDRIWNHLDENCKLGPVQVVAQAFLPNRWHPEYRTLTIYQLSFDLATELVIWEAGKSCCNGLSIK